MRIAPAVLACVIAAGSTAFAQQPAQTPPPREDNVQAASDRKGQPLVPLRVEIVLSRFKGDKKIGSLPYVIGVAANDGGFTSLRMGIDVPISRRGENTPASSISYRSVGTNLDCLAESLPRDRFRLVVRVEDTSVLAERTEPSTTKTGAGPGPIVNDMPAFRSFKSNFTLVLRDGQTAEYTSAVDPISGEVMKIEVTMSVQK